MKNNWLKRLVRWAGSCPDECGNDVARLLAEQICSEPPLPSVTERAEVTIGLLKKYNCRIMTDRIRYISPGGKGTRVICAVPISPQPTQLISYALLGELTNDFHYEGIFTRVIDIRGASCYLDISSIEQSEANLFYRTYKEVLVVEIS